MNPIESQVTPEGIILDNYFILKSLSKDNIAVLQLCKRISPEEFMSSGKKFLTYFKSVKLSTPKGNATLTLSTANIEKLSYKTIEKLIPK